MRTVIKLFISFILILLLTTVLCINRAAYYTPSIQVVENDTINSDILHQLRYLKHEMATGVADDMQSLYPEGYIFMHALYGLAWHDFAQKINTSHPVV